MPWFHSFIHDEYLLECPAYIICIINVYTSLASIIAYNTLVSFLACVIASSKYTSSRLVVIQDILVV